MGEFPEAFRVWWGDTLLYSIADWDRLTLFLYPLDILQKIFFYFVLNF